MRPLFRKALQNLQTIMLTFLVALLARNLISSSGNECLLSMTWQRLFSDHDAMSIRRIQDTLVCCGYNTLQDRAWPFPDHNNAQQCERMYDRTTPCGQRVMATFQVYSGVKIIILLLVGILQVGIKIRRRLRSLLIFLHIGCSLDHKILSIW